jgi:hypothetical protein
LGIGDIEAVMNVILMDHGQKHTAARKPYVVKFGTMSQYYVDLILIMILRK